jgi:DNA-binding phage protein
MDDTVLARSVRCCTCWECQEAPFGKVADDHRAINRVLAQLDERQRRLFAGLLAAADGHGGVVRVAQITGLSRTTIARGMAELRTGARLGAGRVRRRGGGRPRLEKNSRPW